MTTEQVQIHVDFGIYDFILNPTAVKRTDTRDRKSYVNVPIDVPEFKKFMTWYNKSGGHLDDKTLDDKTLDEYVIVIKSLESAFSKFFTNIYCLVSNYNNGACSVQVGPFSFYNYWNTEEYGKLLTTIPSREGYVERSDSGNIAASELKAKHEKDIKFKIMPFVTIGIFVNTKKTKELYKSVEIFDKERKLFNKLFPSYIKPILVGLGGVLVSLFVGYVAHRLANPDEYTGGSKKRFSGGNSIQELIAKIDKTSLTEGQINELNNITTDEALKNFINTHLKELSKEENEQIKKELENKLSPEEKKIIKNDFPGFDLKYGESVFGFLGEKFLGGKQGGKPLTKRHRKKRQNKKRKSRKSKK